MVKIGNMESVGILDIAILVIISACAVFGIFKGFIRQVVSIIAIVLGLWCAVRFTEYMSNMAKEWLSLQIAQQTLHIIMFAVIFIMVIILAHFIGKGIEGIIKLSMLGWLNRIMGFLFGAIKAIIVLSVAVYAIEYLNGMFNIIPEDFLAKSKGYAFLNTFAHKFFPFLQNHFS